MKWPYPAHRPDTALQSNRRSYTAQSQSSVSLTEALGLILAVDDFAAVSSAKRGKRALQLGGRIHGVAHEFRVPIAKDEVSTGSVLAPEVALVARFLHAARLEAELTPRRESYVASSPGARAAHDTTGGATREDILGVAEGWSPIGARGYASGSVARAQGNVATAGPIVAGACEPPAVVEVIARRPLAGKDRIASPVRDVRDTDFGIAVESTIGVLGASTPRFDPEAGSAKVL